MSDDDISFMSSDDLLARIRKDRAGFAQLWDGLSDEQMTQRPGPQEDWSVKDLIAHITWWEKHMVERVMKLLFKKDTSRSTDFDAINAKVFAENKDRSLEDVLTEFDGHLEAVESLIRNLTDEQLNDSDYLSFDGEESILGHVIGNTWGHYGDHYGDLKGYVEGI